MVLGFDLLAMKRMMSLIFGSGFQFVEVCWCSGFKACIIVQYMFCFYLIEVMRLFDCLEASWISFVEICLFGKSLGY